MATLDAEEHEAMPEWLGLASGDGFDANAFSAEEVNRRFDGTA